MRYQNFGRTMAHYLILGINHINENTSTDEILALAEQTQVFVKDGIITDEQYAMIREALSEKTGYDIPEDHETSGLSLEVIAEQVDIHDEAINDIGFALSSILDGGEEPVDPEGEIVDPETSAE